MKDRQELALIPAAAHEALPVLQNRRIFADKETREQSRQNGDMLLGLAVPQLTKYLKTRLASQQFMLDCNRADTEGWVATDYAFSAAIRKEIHGPSLVRRIFSMDSSASSQTIKEKLLPADRKLVDARIHDVIDAVAAMRRYERGRRFGYSAEGLRQLDEAREKAVQLLNLSLPANLATQDTEDRESTIRILTAMLLTRVTIALIQYRISDFDRAILSVLNSAQRNRQINNYDDAQQILVHAYLYGFSPSQEQQEILQLTRSQAQPPAAEIEDSSSSVPEISERIIDAE